ncbi:glutamyl-tRNA(Gln) amidotransferase subunit A, mitochondrial-like [Macrosteles quadrilineatus]|uniref:glutamyl-tRNA(Gln) amidotransferase subunit A, mitochondrial-like n=1 Tax=Macrosteles quadrilineatus TaxID=74068 RepID=UPI0023E31D96|nr:glutamyl-tRNA(Gln) amidotransferase subunit A, mitochondrial-like [Macrosteles quadrilineatus]
MLRLNIAKASQAFFEDSLSATDLCKACLKRADFVRPLNPFVNVTKEKSLRQSEESSRRHKKGESRSILDGIPIAVKDNFCTVGVPTTCGSRMLVDFVPPYNATVVERLENAGAVVIGKTNLDEFAMGSGTVDSVHGPTFNVWGSSLPYTVGGVKRHPCDQQPRISGGSSGGSAVAVATGACFAALGSDTGGSTRNPASYCGIVGLKPTYGRVSRHGLIPLVNSMDVPGILTRSVSDAANVLNVISGCDPLDSTTVTEESPQVVLGDQLNLCGLTVGIPREYHCPGLHPEVLQAWTEVAQLLEEGGANVKQVSMPHTDLSIVCYSVLNQCEVASNMARYDGLQYGHRADTNVSTEQLFADTRSQALGLVVRSRILTGNYFLLKSNYEKYFEQAMKVRRLIAEDFAAVWRDGVDLLLTPTTLSPAPPFNKFTSLSNREQCDTQDYCTQPANMAGCPAVSLPVCLSEDHLPIGLQLIAPNFCEQTLLSVALWLEKSLEFPQLELIDV